MYEMYVVEVKGNIDDVAQVPNLDFELAFFAIETNLAMLLHHQQKFLTSVLASQDLWWLEMLLIHHLGQAVA